MFGFLLFVKSFHWLAGDRIEWVSMMSIHTLANLTFLCQMDQRPYPGPSVVFHIRMTILFGMLWTTDCLMFLFAAEHTISVGVGGMVLFASEVRSQVFHLDHNFISVSMPSLWPV